MGDVSHVIRIGNRYALQAQSRFSPNSDGKFDTFLPPGLQTISDAWEMVIVNTKGEVVFRTTDVSQPWDGSLPDGSIELWDGKSLVLSMDGPSFRRASAVDDGPRFGGALKLLTDPRFLR